LRKKLNVGVIGLGMGRWHLQNYAQCPECVIHALCDLDEGRLKSAQQDFGARYTFTDYTEMLSDRKLDAVTVALPNQLHAPATIAALRAGKHVLCEKPMAVNAAEAEAMVAAAKRAKKQLMIHFNQRFTPDARFLKRYIEAGGLGDIYYAKTGWTRRRGVPGMGSWFTQKALAGGGALIDIGVHMLDFALWMMGYPKSVQVLGSAYSVFGPKMAEAAGTTFDVDDLAAALVKFDNGATLFLEASWASNIEFQDLIYTELCGTLGGAIRRNGQLKIFREELGGLLDATPNRFLAPSETPQQHFVTSLLRSELNLAPGEQGLEVMRILDALYESAEASR
jgi:predicted dehydrogenase